MAVYVGDDEDCLVLKVPLVGAGSCFNLEKAVCNHGFFMMAPNVWEPSTKTLTRPLRLADSVSSVQVSISHPRNDSTGNGPPPNWLNVRVHGCNNASDLPSADQQAILRQVGRMLRVSEKDEKDVIEFQGMHPRAKERGFGRLFRAPSLFEDAVKTILLCFCSWRRTLEMAKALCDLQLELSVDRCKSENSDPKRKRPKKGTTLEVNKRAKFSSSENLQDNNTNHKADLLGGNFPSSRELASLSEEFLKARCNLGLRARSILKLAKSVEEGRLKLDQLELATTEEEAYKKVKKIKGFGHFASASLLMCLGFYQKVPFDTETVRHLKEVHSVECCSKETVDQQLKRIYDDYAPYQCLAYWLELSDSYERSFGKLSELPSSLYYTVAGSNQPAGNT